MTRKRSTKVGKPAQARLSKEQWLDKSLAVLAKKGSSEIRIDKLARELGVTKGSFYHHFVDRADLVRSVVQYWDDKYTRHIGNKLGLQRGTPQEKLWVLMLAILEYGLARYDVAVRALADTDSEVRRLVMKADQFRLITVRSLFSEMGFTDMELDTRTRTFVATMSSEGAVYDRVTAAKRKKLLRAQHRFFTRP